MHAYEVTLITLYIYNLVTFFWCYHLIIKDLGDI